MGKLIDLETERQIRRLQAAMLQRMASLVRVTRKVRDELQQLPRVEEPPAGVPGADDPAEDAGDAAPGDPPKRF